MVELRNNTVSTVVGSALCGAAIYASIQRIIVLKKQKAKDPEVSFAKGHDLVWSSIGGALNASQMYIGDRLDLYSTLRDACVEPESYVTATTLAKMTGFNRRWLREWLAQQASMGVLRLLPGKGDEDDDLHYRLPWATAQVLSSPDSKEYDVSLISCIPALVQRAKTMLPEAFLSGMGRPYNNLEIAKGINRHHKVEIRDTVIPKVIPSASTAHEDMTKGCKVADLGCGAGNLVLALAKAYPNSTIEGYEISQEALSIGTMELLKSKCKNARLIDANVTFLGNQVDKYDVIVTFDVLHDAPDPMNLIDQARKALKPGGVWILGDISGKPSIRQNVSQNSAAGTQFAFSTCLCMACGLSTRDGVGLGTLGFTVPVAERMLKEGGFTSVRVILETSKNTRWFEVM